MFRFPYYTNRYVFLADETDTALVRLTYFMRSVLYTEDFTVRVQQIKTIRKIPQN